MQGSRGVSGTVEVLSARVTEVDGFGVDGGAITGFRLVVNDCCVWAGRGNGGEGEADKMFLFPMEEQSGGIKVKH